MSRETWFVMEDGSAAHPRDVSPDAKGVLRTKDGRAVQMRGDVPRSRSVDLDKVKADEDARVTAEAARVAADAANKKAAADAVAAAGKAKDLKPEQGKPGYKTRETKAE